MDPNPSCRPWKAVHKKGHALEEMENNAIPPMPGIELGAQSLKCKRRKYKIQSRRSEVIEFIGLTVGPGQTESFPRRQPLSIRNAGCHETSLTGDLRRLSRSVPRLLLGSLALII